MATKKTVPNSGPSTTTTNFGGPSKIFKQYLAATRGKLPNVKIGGFGSVAGHPTPKVNPTAAAAAAAAADPAKPVATAAGAPYEDSTYNTAVGNLKTNLSNFGKSLVNQGVGLGQEYGVDYQLDSSDPNNPLALKQTGTNADGTPNYFSIDKNVDTKNPFSRAAVLKQSYDTAKRSDGNSMAARGQLYSGAYQNAQDTDTHNFLQGQNNLLTDFGSRFSGLYGQWLGAQGTEQTGEGTATSDAIARWIASGSPGPAPTQAQVAAAKQFGKPLASAPYIGLGPETTTGTKPGTPSPKPKTGKPKGAGAVTVYKPSPKPKPNKPKTGPNTSPNTVTVY